VLQTPIIEKEAPARLWATLVSFEPGARTNWHTHSAWPDALRHAGAGRAQTWAGRSKEIKAGDVISFEPGEKALAWCRAKNDDDACRMQEALDGVHADWLEKVTDEQYGG